MLVFGIFTIGLAGAWATMPFGVIISLPAAIIAPALGLVLISKDAEKWQKFFLSLFIGLVCGFYGIMMWPIVLGSCLLTAWYYAWGLK